jgi:RHS repeat-associated protein
VGNLVSVTDPNGNIATGTFDANRRALTVTAPAAPAAAGGVMTANTYDADGHLLQVQQSVAGTVLRTTRTSYTLTGKAATTTDANGNVTRYAYDLDDHLIGAIDPVGRVTTFGYDALGRPAQFSNSAIQSAPLVQRAYTPDGLTASLTIARNNTTFNVTNFAYDGFDRLATTTYPDSSTETLGYDADGNVLTRKTRAAQTITFTYHTLNRLATKAAPLEPTVTYTYDLAGRLIGASDTSAAITALVSPSGTLGTASMTYDQVNRPLSFTFGPAPAQTAPTAGSSAFSYAYDLTNRRIGQTATDNSWWSYPTAATTVAYTANSLDQYTAVGAVIPTYDGNGNLTFDGTFTYAYDAESRLVSVTQGATAIATYAYDALGRRKSKTVGGTTTIYINDATARPLPIDVLNRIMGADYSSRVVIDYDGTSGAVQRWYAFGSGPNEVLNQMNVPASTRATFIPDTQGSVVGSLDSTSGIITKTGYQAYGESGSTAGTFRYTGARIDAETNGLYDFRARIYSPALGRFLQADPIGIRGGMNSVWVRGE